eukprot:gene3318-34456_t
MFNPPAWDDAPPPPAAPTYTNVIVATGVPAAWHPGGDADAAAAELR